MNAKRLVVFILVGLMVLVVGGIPARAQDGPPATPTPRPTMSDADHASFINLLEAISDGWQPTDTRVTFLEDTSELYSFSYQGTTQIWTQRVVTRGTRTTVFQSDGGYSEQTLLTFEFDETYLDGTRTVFTYEADIRWIEGVLYVRAAFVEGADLENAPPLPEGWLTIGTPDYLDGWDAFSELRLDRYFTDDDTALMSANFFATLRANRSTRLDFGEETGADGNAIIRAIVTFDRPAVNYFTYLNLERDGEPSPYSIALVEATAPETSYIFIYRFDTGYVPRQGDSNLYVNTLPIDLHALDANAFPEGMTLTYTTAASDSATYDAYNQGVGPIEPPDTSQ